MQIHANVLIWRFAPTDPLAALCFDPQREHTSIHIANGHEQKGVERRFLCRCVLLKYMWLGLLLILNAETPPARFASTLIVADY